MRNLIMLSCLILSFGTGLLAQRRATGLIPEIAQGMSPEQIFKKLSPSLFVVEDLDKDNGMNPRVVAIGSAVAIAPDEVVTNRHVITAGFAWRIRQGDKTWPANIAWIDPNHDLALLRVPGLHAEPVALQESPAIVGERVYAIGAPEGLELTLSEGLISGLRVFQDGHVIQTTTPISPGSSGGGLFDRYGKLTGITSFGLVEGQNLNFALPVGWVQALPKHDGGANQAQLPSKAEKDIFLEASVALEQLNTWKASAIMHGIQVPQSAVSPGTGNAVSSLDLECLFNSKKALTALRIGPRGSKQPCTCWNSGMGFKPLSQLTTLWYSSRYLGFEASGRVSKPYTVTPAQVGYSRIYRATSILAPAQTSRQTCNTLHVGPDVCAGEIGFSLCGAGCCLKISRPLR